MMDVRGLLAEGLETLGLKVDETAQGRILRHLALVSTWNEQVNLTAVTDPQEMIWKHAVDSATLLEAVQPAHGASLIDVGTGAGFPGVVAKALRPDLQLALLESLQKRCRFLEAVGEELFPADPGYQVIWSRAEDGGQNPSHRERYDLVTARAVADLRVLAEYCLPFAKVGGQFVALKGPTGDAEVEAAARAIQTLGGRVTDLRRLSLPGGAGERVLITIKKERHTPKAYPRKAGTPAKKPLE
ncbi:MAG TPA: 16S rRNA (guanine(527)-N(7))-methyltransferase RsmG [Symbiobacteriaceae bacterium]|nr:16S rRNA (guanine(527)-N(7))-methyltransferase RsmG [Symbiobacteriaceae bacterium]